MMPLVSVAMCVRNEEEYIEGCLNSLLSQTFKDFEIVILDDASTDRTSEIISTFKDDRIRVFKNKKCLGIPKCRNITIKQSVGKYIFFTDSDCTVNKTWIEEGLKCFVDKNVQGVEGTLTYVSDDYKPTFSTEFLENKTGGHFMTGSVAYTKKVLEDVGGFNEKMIYLSDREVGLSVLKFGKICFNRNMIAVHPVVRQTPGNLIKFARRIEGRVYLYKKFGDKICIKWRFVNPLNLAKILFPGLIFLSVFVKRFRSNKDYRLLPFTYIFAVLERFYLWKSCIKYRVFLI